MGLGIRHEAKGKWAVGLTKVPNQCHAAVLAEINEAGWVSI